MDYDVEMLRLYFKEKNYSKEKIKEYYLNLSEQFKNCEFIEDESNYKNTCIIRSR